MAARYPSPIPHLRQLEVSTAVCDVTVEPVAQLQQRPDQLLKSKQKPPRALCKLISLNSVCSLGEVSRSVFAFQISTSRLTLAIMKPLFNANSGLFRDVCQPSHTVCVRRWNWPCKQYVYDAYKICCVIDGCPCKCCSKSQQSPFLNNKHTCVHNYGEIPLQPLKNRNYHSEHVFRARFQLFNSYTAAANHTCSDKLIVFAVQLIWMKWAKWWTPVAQKLISSEVSCLSSIKIKLLFHLSWSWIHPRKSDCSIPVFFRYEYFCWA